MALNDEMIALVRAGVPLELGLAELGEDRAGTLGRLASRLAARLSRGESLPEALDHEDMGLPRSYKVIVEAGLRAGRLPAALEGMSQVAFRLADLKRRIGLAMVYPLIVLMLAYGMLLFTCYYVAPRMRLIYNDMGFDSGFYDFLNDIGHLGGSPWGLVFPAVIVALIIWWRRGDGGISQLAGLCPGVGKIITYSHHAQFADLLALLIEHDVPLQEAILLAAEATNDLAIQDAARAIAVATSLGGVHPGSSPGHAGFPPFLYWLITRREEQTGLVSALRAASDMYRRKAVLIAEWIKVAFPVAAAVIIGGGATLIYTLTVFWPYTQLLKILSDQML